MEVTIPLGPVIELLARLFRVSAITASTGKITERLRKSICEFQLEYTNYQFSSSRLHKRFKEADEKEKPALYSNMNELLEAGLKKIFGDLASQIQNYFIETHNSSAPPRVGVHLVTNDNEVINIIQLPASNGGVPPKHAKNYTVLEEVIDTGRPYIENHIPKRILKDKDYKHKGLNLRKVRDEYKSDIMDWKIISRWRNNLLKKPRKDKKWKNIAIEKNKDRFFLYKSHIVIPVTYRRHAEKSSMNEEMIRVLQLEDKGRSILGFLFVDHPDTYYFHDADPQHYDNIDINSLVVFADMFSLVIVTKLMYTIGSKTVERHLENYGD